MRQIHKIYHRKNRTVYATYEPKWEKFQPPFWWCFAWAYKVVYLSTIPNKNSNNVTIKQVSKVGNNSIQIQKCTINNHENKREDN